MMRPKARSLELLAIFATQLYPAYRVRGTALASGPAPVY